MQAMTIRLSGAALLLTALTGCLTPSVNRVSRLPPPPVPDAHWQFAPGRPAADADGYQPPARLAVLLPMSGPMAAAAAPVRDGLLAGYYGESRPRPELRFYDTGSTPEGARLALARASAEGAAQILGPLSREEVAAVFATPLSVPTLALNRSGGAPIRNSASYSLAPEDEGTAAARYLLERQAYRVVVISNGEDAAVRSIDALRAELLRAGGEVVDIIGWGNSASAAGARLTTAIRNNPEVNAVFLAIRGQQARLLAPQLARTRLGERLRVATSQLTQGTGKAQEDRVLDGIVFSGESWPTHPIHANLPPGSTASLPSARGSAARLFAFGLDAWTLSARLSWLADQPQAVVQGATGALRLEENGNVQRTPTWLTFRRGVVTPLDQ